MNSLTGYAVFLVVRMLVLEILEVVQSFFAIEHLDVLRLRRRKLADRPRQMHEVRLDGIVHRMHSNLARQAVSLARVARAACRDNVRPVVRSAA